MLKSVQMPKLGVTMEDGTILEWNKALGDPVEIGDLLLTIETDKAATEYESTDSGILHEILANPGEVIPVGQAICVLREKDDSPG
jgi:pyruvate/2-oxoglutarate dehydrogenase complex dihydrolipoamide acyltransferase (E2) component